MPRVSLQIRNFQSLETANLQFEPGINVIVGDNNVGKSAVFRAIATVYYNILTDYIKFDKSASACQIEHGDQKVLWKKIRKPEGSASKTTYWVNGKEFTKVGKSQLELVASTLNVSEIPILGRKVRLNFWNQEDLPFLMDATPSKVYEFLSLSSEEGNLTDVVRDMRSEASDLSDKIKKTQGSIDALTLALQEEEAFLAKKQGFELVYSDVKLLDAEYSKIIELQTLFYSIKNPSDRIDKDAEELNDVKKRLEPLSSVDELDKGFIDLQNLATLLIRLEDQQTLGASLADQYARVKTLMTGIDISDLFKSLDTIKTLEETIFALSTLDTSLQSDSKRMEEVTEVRVRLDAELESFDVCPLCNQPIVKDQNVSGID